MNPPRKNLAWLWIFLGLAVLTVAATATLATYNIRQQLKREHVDAAIALWKDNGPKNYVLVYTAKKTDATGDTIDRYVVKVKDGRAWEVLANDMPLEDRQLAHYGMHRLLSNVERFMELDAEPGKPKVYTRGVFDGRTGQLAWYVRRVMGSRQRIEITVESFQVQ